MVYKRELIWFFFGDKANRRNTQSFYRAINEWTSNPTLFNLSLNFLSDNPRRVATVREKVLENKKNSRSGKSQGITFSVREI